MASEPTPRSHRQLRHWVADRLRSDILEGRLKPGEWLRQERLAQEHGVSQMPVREALKQLAAEGLVEHVPYRGVAGRRVHRRRTSRTSTRAGRSSRAWRPATPRRASPTRSSTSWPTLARADGALRDAGGAARVPRAEPALPRRSSSRPAGARTWCGRSPSSGRRSRRCCGATSRGSRSTSVPGRDEPDAAEHAEIVAGARRRATRSAPSAAVRRHIEAAGGPWSRP